MKKPVYRHPEFVTKTEDKRVPEKRYWLKLTIDESSEGKIVVILKNPSRATKDISDKTIFNVTNYIYKNREVHEPFKNVGTIIVLNLIPLYETYSENLQLISEKIVDKTNLKWIDRFCSENKNVLIAWGNHPKGLRNEYEEIKDKVLDTFKKNDNNIFYVEKLSAQGNPKHGMVWGYDNPLLELEMN